MYDLLWTPGTKNLTVLSMNTKHRKGMLNMLEVNNKGTKATINDVTLMSLLLTLDMHSSYV